MKNILSILVLLSASTSFAGSGPSTIDCVSSSGRTKLTASSDDCNSELSSMHFEIDGKTLLYPNGHILYAYEDGVITIVAEGHHLEWGTELNLWTIPSSMKVIRNSGHEVKARFRARVGATDPRKFGSTQYGQEWVGP